jgi:amidohydrolase
MEKGVTINFLAEAQNLFDYSQHLRRDFHVHPELGFKEVRTASVVARELNDLGLDVATGIADTGVVATIDSRKPGKVCMLRFDMDALPILEETDTVYASRNPGVMHACGHDGHVAIGLTAARIIAKHRDQFEGSIKLVFQPAEEGLGGAEKMIREGVLYHPRPDYALGIHVWNEKPLGWLGISSGPVMAASEIFRFVVRGKGGHGALPSSTIDPILVSAEIISALQSLVSRNVHPLKTAVVSVTAVHGGQTFNVIPQEVELKGTIRTFDADVREMILVRFNQVVEGIASSMGCKVEIELHSLTPALVNDEWVTKVVLAKAKELWPEEPIEARYATMGSEDMAFFLREIPGCFIFIGSTNKQLGLDAAHHHPKFDFDENVLPRAAGLIASAAFELLSN